MPFKSQAQRGFMYSQHPTIAKRFESETPKGKLPYHAGGGSKPKKPMAAMFGGKKGGY